VTTAFGFVKRHYGVIMATGGAILILMGMLVYTNELFQLNIEAQKFLDQFGLNFFQEV
jgi:cytochrome c-type biogenesis protein